MVVSWDEQGKPLRMIGIHTDITNRKRIEQEMRDAKIAAEQASQAKSQFLANMSHEIRTPMNAILGFSSILSDLITDTIQRYYLDAITKSGKTLLQLINDILDLSKIEAGKFIVQYTPVTIKTLLDEIEIIFSQKFNDKSINFSVEIAEDIPAYLLLDEIRLRQILLNLVGNAVKFTESGFIKISVAAEPCECGSAVHLIISVCDSGIGIAKDQQEQIFAAFTQQKQQDVKYGGTGLGLTICKRLLELMGGDITVESELGKGSCFKLSLKNIRIVEKQHLPLVNDEGLAKNSLDFEPAMILLVDDLPFNRQLIKAYLAEFKELRVVEADSGDLALRLLKQCHFDLILMDRILPGEDGDSICRKIKALPCCGTIPIIMITASVLEVTEQQFQPAYDLQLDKPVNKEQLLSAMQTFLRTKIGTQIKFESDATFPNYASCAVATKQLKALTFLLQQDYQARIALLSQSEIFDLTTILEIAEQLIQLAELHHCELLHIWAKNLKTQAELFDLVETSRTLKSFDELLTQL
jgi:CheY-like chemotaxis protein/nitrogen-specific signal transduction histidine kinase